MTQLLSPLAGLPASNEERTENAIKDVTDMVRKMRPGDKLIVERFKGNDLTRRLFTVTWKEYR